jgi:hypothetical protein
MTHQALPLFFSLPIQFRAFFEQIRLGLSGSHPWMSRASITLLNTTLLGKPWLG